MHGALQRALSVLQRAEDQKQSAFIVHGDIINMGQWLLRCGQCGSHSCRCIRSRKGNCSSHGAMSSMVTQYQLSWTARLMHLHIITYRSRIKCACMNIASLYSDPYSEPGWAVLQHPIERQCVNSLMTLTLYNFICLIIGHRAITVMMQSTLGPTHLLPCTVVRACSV